MTQRERERERVSGKLKKAYYKSFFTLIKAYKRYYLGLQLLALPYFKLTKNVAKTQKWISKQKERFEFLQKAF